MWSFPFTLYVAQNLHRFNAVQLSMISLKDTHKKNVKSWKKDLVQKTVKISPNNLTRHHYAKNNSQVWNMEGKYFT